MIAVVINTDLLHAFPPLPAVFDCSLPSLGPNPLPRIRSSACQSLRLATTFGRRAPGCKDPAPRSKVTQPAAAAYQRCRPGCSVTLRHGEQLPPAEKRRGEAVGRNPRQAIGRFRPGAKFSS